jgi:hypothetical protein
MAVGFDLAEIHVEVTRILPRYTDDNTVAITLGTRANGAHSNISGEITIVVALDTEWGGLAVGDRFALIPEPIDDADDPPIPEQTPGGPPPIASQVANTTGQATDLPPARPPEEAEAASANAESEGTGGKRGASEVPVEPEPPAEVKVETVDHAPENEAKG